MCFRVRPARTCGCRRALEDAAGKLGRDVEANRQEVVGVVEGVRSPCSKGEEVIESQRLRGGEVLDSCVLVVRTTEIHVSGRSTRRVEAEVECEGTFQDPTVGGDSDDSAEEEFEGDALAETGDAEPGLHRLGLRPIRAC